MKPRSTSLDMETIVRLHYDAVYRFCARRIGVDRAADVTQETFLTAQRALAKYRSESSISTWLFGIAHNECRRYYRGAKTEPIILDLDQSREGSASHECQAVDRQALNQALSQLTDEHRDVVLLHEVEGLTYEEAAVVLGVPVGTVKSRLHHAFLHLRRVMGVVEQYVGER